MKKISKYILIDKETGWYLQEYNYFPNDDNCCFWKIRGFGLKGFITKMV